MRGHIVTRDSPGATLTVKINSSLRSRRWIWEVPPSIPRRSCLVEERSAYMRNIMFVNKFMYMIQ